MSSNAQAAEPNAKPAKSKKLIIIGAIVLLLVIAAGAAFFMMQQKHGADEEGGEAAKPKTTVAPTFFPFENMVVNLADPGGDRFAQLGITLELADAKTADEVKKYLPSIRSSVLLLISQRTSTELLTREGKEKLATDILREVSRPLGFRVPAAGEARPAPRPDEEEEAPRKPNPVKRVLFASFIIQ